VRAGVGFCTARDSFRLAWLAVGSSETGVGRKLLLLSSFSG
jgi:hypothetical protein